MISFTSTQKNFSTSYCVDYLDFEKKITDTLNTLTANYEYSRRNTDNLPLLVQMQLSEKLKTFYDFLLHFLNLHYILNILKKNEPHSSSISEVIDSQRRVYLKA